MTSPAMSIWRIRSRPMPYWTAKLVRLLRCQCLQDVRPAACAVKYRKHLYLSRSNAVGDHVRCSWYDEFTSAVDPARSAALGERTKFSGGGGDAFDQLPRRRGIGFRDERVVLFEIRERERGEADDQVLRRAITSAT